MYPTDRSETEELVISLLKEFYPIVKRELKRLHDKVAPEDENGIRQMLGGEQHKPIWQRIGQLSAYLDVTKRVCSITDFGDDGGSAL